MPLSSHGRLLSYDQMRTMLTPPLSTKAHPGNAHPTIKNNCNPKTPKRHTPPKSQWSLPRAHYTCTDSPSDSESSDIDDDDKVNGRISYDGDNPLNATPLNCNDENKENMYRNHRNYSNSQQQIFKRKTDQSQNQFVSVIDTSREQQLAKKCFDSAMKIMNTSISSTISGDSGCTARNKVASVDDSNKDCSESPNEASTSWNNNCRDAISPLMQQSPATSLASSNASTDASSVAASAVTDLFAALRTKCSNACRGDANDEELNSKDISVSPINSHGHSFTPDRTRCTDRKRWIEETLLTKKYTPYQTKEREECCKNYCSHELTTERKKWIEETLLVRVNDTPLKILAPKQTHSSILSAEAGNEVKGQWNRQLDETNFDEEREVSVASSPQEFHRLDNSFLASALVATNMLLSPPCRERYSATPSRHRMSIGATPLPFARPFSPSSTASSAFTETASNVILHAIKQLTPKLSANINQGKLAQRSISFSHKSDFLSIVKEMECLDSLGSHGKEEPKPPFFDQAKLVERVEKLERIITNLNGRCLENDQDETNQLRQEIHKSKQLLEESNQRVSVLMSNLKASQEVHCNVERHLREKIQSLEAEVGLMRNSASYQSEIANVKDIELEELRRANTELLESRRVDDMNHRECSKENENLRSQLLALSNECSAKEQALSSALDNLRSISESFSCINQKLEKEVNAKNDEMTCLQRSLELMSCELVASTNEVIDLRSENSRLNDEVKKVKAGKKWFS